MKTYAGDRTIDGIQVTVNGQPLDECYQIKRFTDLGFEWTYEGNSPRQLALAILVDHLADEKRALEHVEEFMQTVIAVLDNTWQMTSDDIDTALNAQND